MENSFFVGKKVIVTGGAGFIGSNLSKELVSLGAVVHVVDNLVAGSRGAVPEEAIFHEVDICDLEKLLPIFAGAEYVFHLAALASVQLSIDDPVGTAKNNIEGTLSVLEASRQSGVKRVIYSASASAYGDQNKLPLSEKLSPRPKSPYGLQKMVGEYYCQVWSETYSLSTVSLRYFNVYGLGQSAEGDYAVVIPKFLKQRKAGQPLTVTGDGRQTRDFINVKDVVRANVLAAENDKVGKGEVINIGGGQEYSINEIANFIGGEIKYIDSRLELRNSVADISLAKELLGWEPEVSLESGIEELKEIMDLK